MKMNFLTKLSVLVLALCCVGLTACGDTDEPSNPAESATFTVKVKQNNSLLAVANNDTVTITTSELEMGEPQMTFDGVVVNNSKNTIEMAVTVQRYDVGSATDEFCSNLCQPSNGDATQTFQAFSIDGEGDQEFYAHFQPAKEGNNVIRYDFYLTNDKSKSVSVYVNYKYQAQ